MFLADETGGTPFVIFCHCQAQIAPAIQADEEEKKAKSLLLVKLIRNRFNVDLHPF